MSNEILTKEQDQDGIVQVQANPIAIVKEDYNIGSDNMDILRIEICKSQLSREEITSCLTVMQDNIKKESHDLIHMIAPYGFCIGVVLVVISLAALISRRR